MPVLVVLARYKGCMMGNMLSWHPGEAWCR